MLALSVKQNLSKKDISFSSTLLGAVEIVMCSWVSMVVLFVYATSVTTLLLPYPLWLSVLDQLGWCW